MKGSHQILQNPALRMIIEFYPRGLKEAGTTGEAFLETIASLGFSAFLIDRQGRGLLPAEKLGLPKICTPRNGRHVNLFCTRKKG